MSFVTFPHNYKPNSIPLVSINSKDHRMNKQTLLGFCFIFALPLALFGQDHNFTAATGNWEDAANWDVGVPTTNAFAFVNMGGEATLSSSVNANLNGIGDLSVALGPMTSGTLNHVAGTLDSTNSWIRVGGDGGIGDINLSGTAQIIQFHSSNEARIFVGVGNDCDGTLTATDNAMIMTNGDINVANAGAAGGANPIGRVALSGNAMVLANGWLNLGQADMADCTLDLSDDCMLAVDVANMGNPNATVNVNQTGGTFTSNNWIVMSNFGGGDVTYDISGGEAISNGDVFVVAEVGTAQFNVSGTASIEANGNAFIIGRNDGANGTMVITGSQATINVNDLQMDLETTSIATLSFVADSGGVSPIVSADNSEIGDMTTLTVDLTADSNFSAFSNTAGDPIEILLIDNAAPVSGEFAGLSEGAAVDIGGGMTAAISYAGGIDSNDIVLELLLDESGVLVGDVNCDGVIDLLDVQPFVDQITSGIFDAKADIDGNGSVDLLDVGPFVALLGG